jgi:acyl carrier protein
MSSIERQVCALVTSALDVKAGGVRPESTWDDYEADSMDLVELVFALEQHFGISFEIPDLERIKSVADLVRVIEGKVGAG